jgi:hypothetical protein
LYAGIGAAAVLQRLETVLGGRTVGPQTGTLKKQGTKIATKPTNSIAGMSSTTATAVTSLMPAPAPKLDDLGETTGAVANPARTPWSAIVNEAPGIPLLIMVSLDLPTVLRLQDSRSN